MMKQFLVVCMMLLATAAVSAQDERLQVVASFSILQDVAANVAGDAANVATVLPIGADPHSFEPTPRDLTVVADADVVFTNGAFFEEGLLESLENVDVDVNIIEASACVAIIPFGIGGHDHDEEEHHDEGEEHNDSMATSAIAEMCETHHAEFEAMHDESEVHEHADVMGALYTLECGAGHSDNEHNEDEHGDEDHEEGEVHDEHEHGEGSCDPHVWMNPHNVMLWTMLIRDTLIELDPTHADTYTANAAAYLLELDALVHDFVMPMVETVPEENRVLVTNHESLGYFANSYEFEIVSTFVPGGATAIDPSAADVAAIIDTINEEGVPAIFSETTVRDSVAQQIAAETGAELFVLYSGSLSEAGEPAATYIDYITYNVTTIVEALGGGM